MISELFRLQCDSTCRLVVRIDQVNLQSKNPSLIGLASVWKLRACTQPWISNPPAGIPHRSRFVPLSTWSFWGSAAPVLKLKFILTAQRQNFNFLKIGNPSSDEISRGAALHRNPSNRKATSLSRSACSPFGYPYDIAPVVDFFLQATRGACDSFGKTDNAFPSSIASHGFASPTHRRPARGRSAR